MRWLLLVFAIIFVSCESTIDIYVDDGNPVVSMYMFAYSDSAIDIQLSKSVNIFSKKSYETVDDATITISVNNVDSRTFDFPSDTNWVRIDKLQLQNNDSVSVVATLNDGTSLSAKTQILRPTIINSLDTITTTIVSNGNFINVLACGLSFTDALNVNDYYQIVVERKAFNSQDKLISTRIIDFNKDDVVFGLAGQKFVGSQFVDFEGAFDDLLFDGHKYFLNFSINTDDLKRAENESFINIDVRLYHHTYDYYNYFCSQKISEYSSLSQIIGASNVYTNVSGGVGVVSGMSFDSVVLNVNY